MPKNHRVFKDLIAKKFVDRPNLFTVTFQRNNKLEKSHLRDPGRLKELLTPGVDLLLRPALKLGNRKTKYDIMGVLKGDLWILINSGFHSDIAVDLTNSQIIEEFSGYFVQKREYTYSKNQIDFLLASESEEKMLVEVKGRALVEDGLVLFSDALTLRGKRHVEELTDAIGKGLKASILFLITCEDAEYFSPNFKRDPAFSAALETACQKEVSVIAYSFKNNYKNRNLEIKPYKRVEIGFKPEIK